MRSARLAARDFFALARNASHTIEHRQQDEGPSGWVFPSGFVSKSQKRLSWHVDDVEATVAELRANGVIFEEYNLPGLKTVNGIAEIAGDKGAWFKDSEGNLLAIGGRISS
jgi:catechol 2,3-dioxygenase-like lactoylglutathione lyase family enzyme